MLILNSIEFSSLKKKVKFLNRSQIRCDESGIRIVSLEKNNPYLMLPSNDLIISTKGIPTQSVDLEIDGKLLLSALLSVKVHRSQLLHINLGQEGLILKVFPARKDKQVLIPHKNISYSKKLNNNTKVDDMDMNITTFYNRKDTTKFDSFFFTINSYISMVETLLLSRDRTDGQVTNKRAHLYGVLATVAKNQAIWVSTDAQQLGIFTIEDNLKISKKLYKLLSFDDLLQTVLALKMFSSKERLDFCSVIFEGNFWYFKTKTTFMRFNLMRDMYFPDFERIIPDLAVLDFVVFDRRILYDALQKMKKSLTKYASKNINDFIRSSVAESIKRLSPVEFNRVVKANIPKVIRRLSLSFIFKGSVNSIIAYDSHSEKVVQDMLFTELVKKQENKSGLKEFKVCLDFLRTMQVLQAFKEEKYIKMLYIGSTKPVSFVGIDDSRYFHLLMPMKWVDVKSTE